MLHPCLTLEMSLQSPRTLFLPPLHINTRCPDVGTNLPFQLPSHMPPPLPLLRKPKRQHFSALLAPALEAQAAVHSHHGDHFGASMLNMVHATLCASPFCSSHVDEELGAAYIRHQMQCAVVKQCAVGDIGTQCCVKLAECECVCCAQGDS